VRSALRVGAPGRLAAAGAALAVALVVALVALPLVGTGYAVTLLLLTFMYTALASSWNLISGFTGYVSFGHAAFYGTGAYTAGILLAKRLTPWPVAALLAGVAAALLALVLGYPALRLRGPYFAVATLGLAEVVRVAVTVAEPLTGGGKGLTIPPTLNLVPAYYAMGLLAAATVATTALVAASPAGLRLLAIREDETAAEVCGVRTTRHKLAAFCASALFAGVAGGLYAWYASYIDPITVFASGITVRAIAMTMFGGQGTVWGPVLGAAVLTAAGEALWTRFPFLHTALFGALIVVVLLAFPGGVLALLQERGWLPRSRRV
jgi:branched-chain amino acid transport system permease protein